MEYLKQFNEDFLNHKINIHDHYYNPKNNYKTTNIISDDVITDLINFKSFSSACLPIAKQIISNNHQLTLEIPKIGDLFIGILHQNIIGKVTFIMKNYIEKFEIEGSRYDFDSKAFWKFTQFPIPLINILNYDLSIKIDLNFDCQMADNDVFKAYYGYLNKSIQSQILSHQIYKIPLINNKYLKIICGILNIE